MTINSPQKAGPEGLNICEPWAVIKWLIGRKAGKTVLRQKMLIHSFTFIKAWCEQIIIIDRVFSFGSISTYDIQVESKRECIL